MIETITIILQNLGHTQPLFHYYFCTRQRTVDKNCLGLDLNRRTFESESSRPPTELQFYYNETDLKRNSEFEERKLYLG